MSLIPGFRSEIRSLAEELSALVDALENGCCSEDDEDALDETSIVIDDIRQLAEELEDANAKGRHLLRKACEEKGGIYGE